MIRKPFEKKCVRCGKWKHFTKFPKSGITGRGKTKRGRECKTCRSLRRKQAHWDTKWEAIKYLGGTCSKCGLESPILDVYDFHHVDPDTKLEIISKLIQDGLSLEELKPELKKCVLLCKNCHAIVHYMGRHYADTD